MAMRAETKHSMLRRCNGWDYRQPCIYQITLVLADRKSKALGRLEIPALPSGAQNRPLQVQGRLLQANNVSGSSVPSAEAIGSALALAASAEIALTPAGEAVKREFWALGEHHPEIKPLFIQVMPDHVHFIIHVTKPMARHLGQAMAGFKTGSSKAAIGKGGLWAEGFQDTILFHEGQLDSMFAYLRDNPRRLAVKQLFPDLFRVRNDLILALPRQAQKERELPLSAQNNLGLPLSAQNNLGLPPQAQNRPLCSVLGAGAPSVKAHFSAIGNLFLLDSPNIIQVQCSRSYLAYRRIPKPGGGLKIARNEKGEPIIEKTTPEFETKRDELLAAAKHGAVLISPCISDGEREIARLAFAAGLPLIALRNMGFSPLYKPGGKLFDQTANGRLLLLAPAAWPYQTAEKRMTRFDACAMNRIAQLIAGDGAAEINYHGMKPNDIDRLVCEAVKGGQDGR
ncbi:MAG: hypothetical protein IJ146_00620 [Kiritimatiellae bacterium]|nr:hypothetical protein [Kiritimatiellia bacterium]